MKTIRVVTVLFLLIASTRLYAGMHNPGCGDMEKWAMGYNPGDIWQLTPYVRFPAIARDEKVSPLFGNSVTEWSNDDFAQFHQWMHTCRQAAAEQGRSQTVTALSNADRAILNLPRYVEPIQRSRTSLDAAIEELKNLPDNADKKNTINLAERALRGRLDYRQVSALPSEMQTNIQSITNAKKYLPKEEIDRYSKSLTDMATAAEAIGSEERIAAISEQAKTAEHLEIQMDSPTLAKGSNIMSTRFEGVSIGMNMDAAIKTLKKKGYKVKRHANTLQRLNMVKQYPVDMASLEKGSVTPFPGGKMTKEQAREYQTLLAIDAVKTKNAELVAFEGRVANVSINGASFEQVDDYKRYVVEMLGKPDDEYGGAQAYWNMTYYADPEKTKSTDAYVSIKLSTRQLSNMTTGESTPYTFIQFTAAKCQPYPKCK
jgi:hypothetical protein